MKKSAITERKDDPRYENNRIWHQSATIHGMKIEMTAAAEGAHKISHHEFAAKADRVFDNVLRIMSGIPITQS